MKVWLDDIREMPEEFTDHAVRAVDALDLLATNTVTLISLDHDLGSGNEGTGYDVAKWIEEQARLGDLNKLEWRLHTANPVGAKNMKAALVKADEYWELLYPNWQRTRS